MYTSYAYTLFHGPYCILYGVVCVLFFFNSPCFYDRYITIDAYHKLLHRHKVLYDRKKMKKKMLSEYSRALSISHEIVCPMLLVTCVLYAHIFIQSTNTGKP